MSLSATNNLFNEHLDFADYIARCAVGANLNFDDAFSSTLLGLWRATVNYDENKGTSFKTYAERRMKGQIIDDEIKMRQGCKRPNQVEAEDPLTQKDFVSLQAMEEKFDSSDPEYDVLVRCSRPQAEEMVDKRMRREILCNCFRILNRKQRIAVTLYYYEDFEQPEIAKILGVSGGRVSQLISESFVKLKRCSDVKFLYKEYYC
jgi:RNA polymerase sigma factor for flagellar operon FliA